MLSIRSHPKLQLLFKLSKITGFNVPESPKSKSSLLTPWELTVFAIIFTSLILLLFCLLKDVKTIRLAEISQLVIPFMMYFSVLAKTFNLLKRKRHLLELFSLMDELTAFSPFADYQKPVIDLVCKRIRKTMILLACLTVGFAFCGTSMHYVIRIIGQYKLAHQSNVTTNSHEEMAKRLVKISNELDWIERIAYGMNTALLYCLPLKSVVMDSYMFLGHFFVVQQLNLLNKKFHLFKQRSSKMKSFHKIVVEEKDFEKWLEMFNKIRA